MKLIYALTPVIMKHKPTLITILAAALILLAASPGMTEVGLINMKSVLSSYGFKGGNFNDATDISMDLYFDDANNFSQIEGHHGSFTAEEFITAAYYTPVQISNVAKAKIEKELPHSKDGALKLASMWMKKAAIYPENAASYQKAIDIIKQKSNVNDAEIRGYYTVAVEKEAMKLGKKHLGKYYSETELKNTTLKPIIDYMLNPTRDGSKKIDITLNSLINNPPVYTASGKIINAIDSSLPAKVYLAAN